MKLHSPRELWSHEDEKVREFGKAFFVFLAVIGAIAAHRALRAVGAGWTPLDTSLPIVWQAARHWWLSAWAVLTFSAAFPWFSRPVYVLAMLLSMCVGFVLSNVILFLMFATLFVFIGRMRAASSPIKKGFESGSPTYWQKHKGVEGPARYYRQY